MVETPALIPSQPVHKSTATVALVLGIVGIFIPFIGVILGILAIIFGSIALRKKTTSVAPAVVGIVTGAVAILVTAIVIGLITFFMGHPLFVPSDRDRAVTAMINEKKDFGVGETATIGSNDVTITNVERNYTPTADEQKQSKYDNPVEATGDPNTLSNYRQDTGTDIDETDAEYVVVKGTTARNQSLDLEDGGFSISDWRLNKVRPYYTAPAVGDSSGFSIIYRIRKDADKLVLKGDITIFTSVSPIVGTEGAPRKTLTYSIALN
jgi:lipopolysaccharide export LptBFGC system permease protein LptF